MNRDLGNKRCVSESELNTVFSDALSSLASDPSGEESIRTLTLELKEFNRGKWSVKITRRKGENEMALNSFVKDFFDQATVAGLQSNPIKSYTKKDLEKAERAYVAGYFYSNDPYEQRLLHPYSYPPEVQTNGVSPSTLDLLLNQTSVLDLDGSTPVFTSPASAPDTREDEKKARTKVLETIKAEGFGRHNRAVLHSVSAMVEMTKI